MCKFFSDSKEALRKTDTLFSKNVAHIACNGNKKYVLFYIFRILQLLLPVQSIFNVFKADISVKFSILGFHERNTPQKNNNSFEITRLGQKYCSNQTS